MINQKGILVVLLEITFKGVFKSCLGERGNAILAGLKRPREDARDFERKLLKNMSSQKELLARSEGITIYDFTSLDHPFLHLTTFSEALLKATPTKSLSYASTQTMGSVISTLASIGHTPLGDMSQSKRE
ncbi:hypothetical protein PVK06_034460 [Gossypium arboreum]|uniref:Uncharacterized protein n=1 Tax=Gossypium arboreum TaxID=29729 RepID=A0ABR0NE80_GOSAR|nr:hypothetical protein PVK06_034460 [Gossypium arboreum]